MRLYFVRHGESEANLLREFSNRGLKHGLTERGRKQVTALAQKLKGKSIRKLFTSPLLRAIETTEILSQTLSKSYEVTEALREYDCGVLEGRSDAASWALYDRVLQEWITNRNWESRIEGGESFLDIKARFVPFIEQLSQTYQHVSTDFILVGHGGLYHCMLPLVLTNIDFDFALSHPLSNTACIVAELRSSGLVCLTWDEIPIEGK